MDNKLKEIDFSKRNACIVDCVLEKLSDNKTFMKSDAFKRPSSDVALYTMSSLLGIYKTLAYTVYDASLDESKLVYVDTIDPYLSIFLDHGVCSGGKISVLDNTAGACIFTTKKGEKWLVFLSQMMRNLENTPEARIMMPDLPPDLHGCVALVYDGHIHFYAAKSFAKDNFSTWNTMDSQCRKKQYSAKVFTKIRNVVLPAMGLGVSSSRDVQVVPETTPSWTQLGVDCAFCAMNCVLKILDISPRYTRGSSYILRESMYFVLVMSNAKNVFFVDGKDSEAYHTDSPIITVKGTTINLKMEPVVEDCITPCEEKWKVYNLLMADKDFRAQPMLERLRDVVLICEKTPKEGIDCDEPERDANPKSNKHARK